MLEFIEMTEFIYGAVLGAIAGVSAFLVTCGSLGSLVEQEKKRRRHEFLEKMVIDCTPCTDETHEFLPQEAPQEE